MSANRPPWPANFGVMICGVYTPRENGTAAVLLACDSEENSVKLFYDFKGAFLAWEGTAQELQAQWNRVDPQRSELLPLLADCVTFLEQAFAHSPNKPACLAPAKAAVDKYSV